MRKLLVKLALAAALVVGAHVCLCDSYDVDTLRGYFESALEMESSFDGKTTRCSLAVDSAERTELVRLIGEKNSLRLLGVDLWLFHRQSRMRLCQQEKGSQLRMKRDRAVGMEHGMPAAGGVRGAQTYPCLIRGVGGIIRGNFTTKGRTPS